MNLRKCIGGVALMNALAALFIVMTQCAHAEIIYKVVNDTVDQNGWNLLGTITTDGTLGKIGALNIISVDLMANMGGTAYELKSPEYSARLSSLFGTPNGLVATTTALILPYTETPNTNQLGVSGVFGVNGIDFASEPFDMSWENSDSGFFLFFMFSPTPTDLWSTSHPTGYGPPGTDWTIATAPNSIVPEPSSFALLGLGGIGLAFGAFGRRWAQTAA